MTNAYIYPVTKNSKPSAYNPYIDNFIKYLSPKLKFLNNKDFSSIGILNIIKYHRKIDYIFLHWIENVPDRKFGILQTFFFIVYMYVFKGNRKVIWVMHNKVSHFKKYYYLKKLIFYTMLRKSHLILTHANDGVAYAQELGRVKDVIYIPHPIVFQENSSVRKEFDVLIWGSILPYKGIHDFLQHLKQREDLKKYSINIIGKASDPLYFQELKTYQSDHIKIENRYIENSELKELVAKARCVLFPYNSESVLSSGALMDTIGMGGCVIGPSKGAFKDLAKTGMILTYKTYNQLTCLLDNIISDNNPRQTSVESYELLTWENFSEKFFSSLNA